MKRTSLIPTGRELPCNTTSSRIARCGSWCFGTMRPYGCREPSTRDTYPRTGVPRRSAQGRRPSASAATRSAPRRKARSSCRTSSAENSWSYRRAHSTPLAKIAASARSPGLGASAAARESFNARRPASRLWRRSADNGSAGGCAREGRGQFHPTATATTMAAMEIHGPLRCRSIGRSPNEVLARRARDGGGAGV